MSDILNGSLPKPGFKLSWIKYIIGLALLIWLLTSTFVFIPPGYVGSVYDSGTGVQDRVLGEGLSLTIPFWQRVQLFDARIQEYTMASQADEGAVIRDDSLDAPTADGQQVRVDATVLFMVERDSVPQIWREVGTNYVDKLIRTVSRSQIRMIISRYTAPQIYSERRQEAETVMTKEIQELLKPKHIIVDKVLLRAVNFTPEYSKAIEQKVIAEQKVKEAEYKVKQASQEAQARIVEAKGLAEAQFLQRQTLNQEYLQLEAIKKWNGVLPQVSGGDNAPLINIPLK